MLLLQHNEIATVSDDVNSLLSLDDLNVSHNKLKTLPDAFTFLSRTKKVTFGGTIRRSTRIDSTQYTRTLTFIANKKFISLYLVNRLTSQTTVSSRFPPTWIRCYSWFRLIFPITPSRSYRKPSEDVLTWNSSSFGRTGSSSCRSSAERTIWRNWASASMQSTNSPSNTAKLSWCWRWAKPGE